MVRDCSEKIVVKKENVIKTNQGIFQGWGSSLCWWANRIGYSTALTEKAAELFYGKSGLELNIMRYNIGGGDNPEHHHIKRTDSAIPGWTRWNESKGIFEYDYEADKNQVNVLEKCYEKAGKQAYVEAFSNSAPYYMTKSGCSSGGNDPSTDNLKEDSYEEFAEYLAHVCNYLQEHLHIRISSIAAMNEPNTDYWIAMSEKQEGCHFDPGASQSRMLVATEKAFRQLGLNQVEITASDETSTDKQLLACESYTEEAWKVIERISTHTYGVEKRKEMGEYTLKSGYNLWMSEVDGSFVAGEHAGEMGAALGYGKKIIDDINELSPSAWVMWQLIDNHISKQGYNDNKDFGMPDTSGGYWGVAVADHDREEIVLTKKYYAFGQFTKYIHPGDKLILCGDNALASYNPDTNQINIVVINDSEEKKKVMIDLSEFSEKETEAEVIRTSGTMHNGENWSICQPVKVKEGILKAVLKEYSITTFCVYGE